MSYQDYLDTVQKYYIAYYQRPADPQGLRYWAEKLDAAGGAVGEIIESFANSDESKELYGDINSNNIENVISNIYQAALGRTPDSEGLQYYVDGFNNGDFTPASIMVNIADGAIGIDATVLQNKIDAAKTFTEILDPDLDQDASDDQATYDGEKDALTVRDWLAGVEATVPSEKEITADIISQIVDPGDPLYLDTAFSTVNEGVGDLLSYNSPEIQWVDSGISWFEADLSYSFPYSMPDEYVTYNVYEWSSLNSYQNEATKENFYLLEDIIDIKFTETSDTQGDIRINNAEVGSNYSGYAYYPGPDIGGDIFIDNDIPEDDSYTDEVILHELGHSMGLKHPFEGDSAAPAEFDNTAYTIMSYTHAPYITPSFYYEGDTISFFADFHYRSDFGIIDIAALQSKYGYSNTNAGDTIYKLEWGNYKSIWDAEGTDELDFSDFEDSSFLNLTPGTLSSAGYRSPEQQMSDTVSWYADNGYSGSWVEEFVSNSFEQIGEDLYTGENNLGIAWGTIIENVTTGNGDDNVIDNSVDNIIKTGNGNDQIFLGKGGYDKIYGGSGEDSVIIDLLSDDVQLENNENGSYTCVTNDFAADLYEIELVSFTDQVIALA